MPRYRLCVRCLEPRAVNASTAPDGPRCRNCRKHLCLGCGQPYCASCRSSAREAVAA